MSTLDKYRNNIKTDEENFGGKGNFPIQKAIKPDLPNIMRILDPDSAVEYFESWMVCDDGEKRPFIVENDHQGKSILAQMLGDRQNFYKGGILDSRLDEFKNKYFFYESSDPELILQVAYNNDRSGDNGNWRPTRRYAFNIIDREPETEGDNVGQNWCVANKHTKLFVMGSQGLTSLLDVRDNDGNLENYDVNYKRTGKGKKGTTHNVMKAGEALPHVVFGPITDEERYYERYDLKTERSLASATYVLKYLKDTIARIDAVLGTQYLSELQQQANLEGADTEDAPAPPPRTAPPPSKKDVPKDEPKKETSVPPAVESSTETPVRTRSSEPVAQGSSEKEMMCPFCKKQIPDDSEVCPLCKKQLLAPCDNPDCKKPFLVTLDTCPYCGKTYKLG